VDFRKALTKKILAEQLTNSTLQLENSMIGRSTQIQNTVVETSVLADLDILVSLIKLCAQRCKLFLKRRSIKFLFAL